jgi:hypothetical protein
MSRRKVLIMRLEERRAVMGVRAFLYHGDGEVIASAVAVRED